MIFSTICKQRCKPKDILKIQQNKNDLGDDFIAPDGGWGWLVCVATGLTNFCIMPSIALFGLIFRDEMTRLKFSNSEIVTIINCHQGVWSTMGLLNGPMFRMFSYRQVAFAGVSIITISLFLTSIADSFLSYIIFYSIMYGLSIGISLSASALALNTYFMEKRRRASSFSCTLAGLGPLVMPYIITFLVEYYGVRGTVIILSGLSLNALPFILTFQPVQWHIKKIKKKISIINNAFIDNKCHEQKSTIHNFYGSELSLTTPGGLNPSMLNLNHIDEENDENRKTCYQQKENLQIATISKKDHVDIEQTAKTEDQNKKWYTKVARFFDLYLLKDITYVNLMVGLTLSAFSDLNFSVLTPFFLSDFGFTSQQIAFVMSLIAGADLIVRFSVPFLVENIHWENRIFFLISLIGMIVGRSVIAMQPNFNIVIGTFVWLGICKGIRTVFLGLIIPSHVPLKRLPAALGLQLLFNGIFTFSIGPIVGFIRDASNFSIALIFLNLLSSIPVITWTVEIIYKKVQKHKKQIIGLNIR